MRLRLSALLLAVVCSGCTCQRPENIEAKARLTKPQPQETSNAKAAEVIDIDGLTDAAKMARVAHMDGSELAVRLGSFVYKGNGELSFGRDGDPTPALRSAENTTVMQSSSGDFSVSVVTGDGTEQKLAYVNDIFFLKNNNGQWRVSRDPSGERNTYRTDAMAVWASFYDLVAHALVVERTGATSYEGRGVVGYSLKLPDETQKALAEGATVDDAAAPPTIVPGVDGGPDTVIDAPEEEGARRKRIAGRVSKWAKRAHPAGGTGRMLVDDKTGAPLLVEFTGELVVGDGKQPARLKVKLTSAMTEIGKDPAVSAPQDAIDEVVRKKVVVGPRIPFEEAGVVAPIPRDAGPDGSGPGSKP
ncbi:MAG TPA: hypothetical protein VGF99_11935, partial [Myxococcota bacterium]